MKLPLSRWILSLPAAMFYCMAAVVMHETLGSTNGAPALLDMLARLLLSGSVALWVLADARQADRPLPYDAGLFFFLAWPVLTPIYLFSTRGWRAFATLGWFLLLYLAAGFLGSMPFFLLTLRQ